MNPERAVFVAWALWLASWIIAALWAAPAAIRPGFGEQGPYRIVTLIGGALLFDPFQRLYRASFRLWDFGPAAGWLLFALAVLGFAFAWWARLYLGRLWSSSVTRKADHHVVDTGPYAIVRHPIYTGLIAACFATALLKGTLIGMAGAVLMTLGFAIKAKLEERFLREQLGAEAYDSYRRRVPMLVPFAR